MRKIMSRVISRNLAIWLSLAIFTASIIGLQAVNNERAESQLKHYENVEDEIGHSGDLESIQWRRLTWLDDKGEIPTNALINAKNQIDASTTYWQASGVLRNANIASTDWVPRGPQNIGGRTLSLVINPTDPQMMWAAAASGGIWFTANGGTSWVPINDSPQNQLLPTMSAHSLVMQPGHPNIIYCGTGEGETGIGTDGEILHGAGIFKTINSTDGGNAQWTQLASTSTWDNVPCLTISQDGAILAIANGLIYRSTNGGNNWSISYDSGSYHVAFHPNNSNKAIASVFMNGHSTAVYSTQGGASGTWQQAKLAGNPPNNDVIINVELGVKVTYAPSNPDIVYLSAAENSGNIVKRKIWRSTDGGATYTRMTSDDQTIPSHRNGYTHSLWVSPADATVLVAGGIDLHRSTNSGATFTQISINDYLESTPHPDQHFTVSPPNDPSQVYVCTDGGIYRTTNGIFEASQTSGWLSLNQTYQTTQFYAAAATKDFFLGGTQDNGTLRLSLGNTTATSFEGGDGGYVAIDPKDDTWCYGELQNMNIFRSHDHGLSRDNYFLSLSGQNGGAWRIPPNVIPDAIPAPDGHVRANFIAPFILDPVNVTRMYAGGISLWKSDNLQANYGDTSNNVSWSKLYDAPSNISAIAVAPTDTSMIWLGTKGGQVRKSTNSGTDWQNILVSSAAPTRFITRIYIDPSDANTVYVTLGGFCPDNLYRTTDAGSTWNSLTGTGQAKLPDAPVRDIVRHPSIAGYLYAATEMGVFASENSGLTWMPVGPNKAPVFQIFFIKYTPTLVAATYGRGIWTVETGGNGCPSGGTDNSQFAQENQNVVINISNNQLTAGQRYTHVFELTNTGMSYWNTQNGFELIPQNPALNTYWGKGQVEIGDCVAPGYIPAPAFAITIMAPPVAKTYNLQWRVYKNGIAFGASTPNLVLTVVPDPNDQDNDGILNSLEASSGTNPNVKDNHVIDNIVSTDNGASKTLFVNQVYRDLLYRERTAADGTWWIDQLNGGLSRAEVIAYFFEAQEFYQNKAVIIKLYQEIFNRLPDYEGTKYWLDEVAANRQTQVQVANAFINSEEFVRRWGVLSDENFVRQIFLNALNRQPTTTELNNRLAQLSGGTSRGAVALAMTAPTDSLYNEFDLRVTKQVQIIEMYMVMLLRIPTANENTYWLGQWANAGAGDENAKRQKRIDMANAIMTGTNQYSNFPYTYRERFYPN